ncbi:unnamed protein product, partial [Rhizoctonia solani]
RARIDQQAPKTYVGVDLFYGQNNNVKGIVFVTQSRALLVRVPDNAAKTSAEQYEKRLAEKAEQKPKSPARNKGQKTARTIPERTPYERLRQLLDLNLVAFGMAQISLTLWDTLREKVRGVNLSTVTSSHDDPPPRAIPDPNPPANNGEPEKNDAGKEGKKNSQDFKGEKEGYRGRGGRGRGRSGRNKSEGRDSGSTKGPKMIRVELPEDKEECLDRPVLSPGEVVQQLYPKISRMDINAVFFGQEEESDMVARVAEAISRAWVAYVWELTFFSKSMVAAWIVMGEGEAQRPIEREDMAKGRTNELVSQSQKKRVRASKHQEIRVRTKDGEQKTFYTRRVFGNAKAVKLDENEIAPESPPKNDLRDEKGPLKGKKNGRRQHTFKDLVGGADEFNTRSPHDEKVEPSEVPLFDMDNVDRFQVYGRAEATMPEVARDLFILRLLEGRCALRGPEFEDCEFIRRVWFPNHAQIETGKKREPPPPKERYDWVEGSWGDSDSDEEDPPVDYDTEDEKLGHNLPLTEVERMIPKLKDKINPSQLRVIGRVTAPNAKGRTRATLVHGPPGTGKTSTITAAAIRLVKSGEYVWIVAQSNVGISNVAGKLLDIDFTDFVLIVSEDYFVWSEKQYTRLKPYLVRTIQLKGLIKRFAGKKLVLSTLASLSNRLVEDLVMYKYVPLQNLIIDEASQIDMTSQFMHLFFKHRYILKNVCWFGDPKQLPPYGWSETIKINDIFQVAHLQANSKIMDVSYRLPVPIAKFISKNVYQGKLEASPFHKVIDPTDAILFVDTPKGMEEGEVNGTSSLNQEEADVVVRIAELYYHKEDGDSYEFDIITPYEAQRRLVQNKLKSKGIEKEVFNVDSFQGREADYIITTLTKTTFSSFLTSVNRL